MRKNIRGSHRVWREIKQAEPVGPHQICEEGTQGRDQPIVEVGREEWVLLRVVPYIPWNHHEGRSTFVSFPRIGAYFVVRSCCRKENGWKTMEFLLLLIGSSFTSASVAFLGLLVALAVVEGPARFSIMAEESGGTGGFVL